MNKHVVLKRRIAIRGWRVVGYVSKADKRKELEPILERARETGGTDADDVARHLLFESSRKVVAQRLLRIGRVLNLLEENGRKYRLTADGERAIDTGNVFVPEHGAWTVWVSEDPLLPSPVLRIDAWEELDALTESRNRRDAEKKRSFEPLPDIIREVQETEVTPPASGDGVAVRVGELEENVEAVSSGESLNLIWSVHERRLRLQGKWDNKTVDFELEAPETPPDELWEALLAGEGLLNDWERHALRVSFAETTESERESMSRDLEIPKPSVPRFGEFEPLTVPEIAIAARSRDDARDWSAWRLRTRIRDFATSERYDEWRKEAAAPFVEHRPELPARAELAAEEWANAGDRPAPRAWHLVAAEDWRL